MLLFSITPLISDSELPFIKLGKTQFQAPAPDSVCTCPSPRSHAQAPCRLVGSAVGEGWGVLLRCTGPQERVPKVQGESPWTFLDPISLRAYHLKIIFKLNLYFGGVLDLQKHYKDSSQNSCLALTQSPLILSSYVTTGHSSKLRNSL